MPGMRQHERLVWRIGARQTEEDVVEGEVEMMLHDDNDEKRERAIEDGKGKEGAKGLRKVP